MAVRVAKRYHKHDLKFCIITFYDSQRSAIAKALEVEKVPSGCVYNVDSFQGTLYPLHITSLRFRPQLSLPGNETDYVILSSVRTQEPGFLESIARMNVALTRCRRGLIVVTNKSFLQRSGKSTLLGKLCHSWSLKREAWINWRTMLGTEVDLPGIQMVRM
jgi:superfamily I DNA and/or RNA helicase